jgi:multidrug efflux pump subunit AcrA (membrane-fusion protein)
MFKNNCKFISGLIFSLFLLAGCQPKAVKEKPKEAIPVRVSKVASSRLDEALEYVGNIKAKDEVFIYPKVSGKIIEKVKEDGANVTKGEAIAYIDRDEVGLTFEKAPVESTVTGVVGRIYVDIGENVIPLTAVALVVNMDKVKIDLDIPEKYLPKISLRQEARVSVDAYPKKDFIGSVTKISPVVDLGTRTAPIEITIDNPEHDLKSGMFARVRLVIEERHSALVVLKESIMGREPNTYVYVIEDKRAVLRKISLGFRQGPYYEVREGLKEGDLVVIMGQQRLYEGAAVEAEESKE